MREAEYKPFGTDRFRCYDCGEHHNGYMLRDSVWREVVGRDEYARFICINDAAKRLGRRIRVSDLKSAPINDTLLYVLEDDSDRQKSAHAFEEGETWRV